MKNTTILLLITLIAFAYSQQQCPVGCGNCTAINGTINCTTCTPGNFLVNATCPRCPQGCNACNANPQGRPVCTNCAPPGQLNALGACFVCDPSCATCTGNPTNCTSCREGTQLQLQNSTGRCGPLANCSFANCAQCGPDRQNQTICVRCVRGYFSFRGRCLACKFPCKECNYDVGFVNDFVQRGWERIFSQMFGLPPNTTFNATFFAENLPFPFLQAFDFANMNETSKQGWVQGYLGFQFFASQFREINNVNFSAVDPALIMPLMNVTGPVDGPLIRIVNSLFNKNYTVQQFYNRTFPLADILPACTLCSVGFQNSSNVTGACQKCPPRCLACSGGFNTCDVCEPGFFINGSNLCQRCNETCLQCSQVETNCTKCAPPTSLSNNMCIVCNNSACATCRDTNINLCLTCKLPFSSSPDNNGVCYRCGQDLCKTCLPSTLVDNVTVSICTECKLGSSLVDGKCTVCPPNCQSCSTGASPICFQCKVGFSLISENNITRCGSCPPGCLRCSQSNSSLCLECITGTFLNQNSICQKCKDGCQACTSLEVCTSFQAGVVIINNKVVNCRPGCKTCDLARPDQCSQCGPRYFLDGINCRQCSPGCVQCSDPSTCTKCADNLNLNGGNCSECQGNCRTCPAGNSTLCLSCKRGTILVGTQCLKQCERGCLDCDPTNTSICLSAGIGHALRPNGRIAKCLGSCSGSCDPRNINQCLSCVDGFELFSGQCKRCPKGCATCLNGQCQTCVVGFRLIQNLAGSFICAQNCKPPCTDCTQTGSCLVCEAGFNLTNGGCQPFTGCNPNCEFCPSGTFKNQTSGQCRPCGPSCASCTSSNCLQCQGGYYLNNNQCLTCPVQCKTCYGDNRCIECTAGFVKQIVSMDSDVSGAVYSDNCKPCDSNCKTCQVQPERCTSCHDGMRLFSSRCAGMFTVVYQYTININYDTFLENSDSQGFIEVISRLIGISTEDNYINQIRNGSVILGGTLSTTSSDQANTVSNNLNSVGTNIPGYSVLGASTSVYYGDSVYVAPPATEEVKTEEKPNVGLIVGVVVGGVVLIAIVAILIYKFKCQKPSVNDGGEASGIQLNEKGRR